MSATWLSRSFQFDRLPAQLLVFVVFSVLAVAAQAEATAQEKAETPHEIVELVTEELFGIVRKYDGGSKDPDAFHAEVTKALEPVVHFGYIARVVMGPHAKEASDEQVRQFAEVFKRGLVRTYARGIAGYVDSDIKVAPPSGDISGEDRVSVQQNVRHRGSNHRLSYSMRKNSAGEWWLINLVLDGVNLGSSFRSQFNEAARKHDGDLDKVIDTWLDEA